MASVHQEPRRAQAPRPPSPTPAVEQNRAERAAYLKEREAQERRSLWRGLLLLALLILVVALVRAGGDRTFYPGWWRQW